MGALLKFDPLKSSQKIAEDYRRYILTTFRTDDDRINEQLSNLVSISEISNGPYLSINKNYERIKKMSDMISDPHTKGKPLSKGFFKLTGKLNADKINLYQHQVTTFTNVLENDHNLILSTGTGSGKTLSFLIPVLSYLLDIEEKKTLDPGVTAMLVYPMNALANDQMDNLRDYLKGTKITFGSFTGETPHKFDQNIIDDYKEKHGFKPTNELLFRDQMINTPPNILITNYSMLEHLLIKPENKSLFGKPGVNHWKFIILDEAHIYSGAKGSEVSILLRRLNETLKMDQLRYILTSATLGGKEDDEKVVNFANELCGIGDSDCPFTIDDIVRASYHPIAAIGLTKEIEFSFFIGLSEIIQNCDIEEFMEDEISEYLDSYCPNIDGNYQSRLFDIISKDSRIYKLYKILEKEPLDIYHVQNEMEMNLDFLIIFIQIASLASKDGYKLFDSKYHMFIRSIDGVFSTLTDDPKVFIHPIEEFVNTVTKQKEQVYQISTCNNCGHIYLVGKVSKERFTQSPINEEIVKDSAYMLIEPNEFDEDDYTDNELQNNMFRLCTICGKIKEYGFNFECNHDRPCQKYLYCKQPDKTKVTVCQNCGQRENIRGMLRQLYLGHDSSTAVLASSLYAELYNNTDHRFLSFSDNRQNAAYFAPYLEDSHENIILHAAMWKSIQQCKDKLEGPGMPITEFKTVLEGCINSNNISTSVFEGKQGNLKGSQDAWSMLLIDSSKYNSNKSFEFIGQIYYTIDHLILDYSIFKIPEEKARELVNQIGKVIRDGIHITIPNEINNEDVMGKYYGKNRPFEISLDSNNKIGKEPVLLTAKIKKYLTTVVGETNTKEFARVILRKCCKHVDGKFSIDLETLKVKRKNHAYQCTTCKKTTPFNVDNICIRCCTPTLKLIDTSIPDESNSYIHNYVNSPLRSIRIKEHTAQLNPQLAREYQDAFKNKKLDALSCSTTFEVGVDIGNLNIVLMRNVPPSPANYIQRAGRAGRSPESSAYALTFCKNSSHDTTYFKNPVDMIQGKVPVPNIKSNNPRIVIRHIFATALSYYWRNECINYPKHICMFIESVEDFEKYLNTKPEELKQFLKGIVSLDLVNYVPDENDKDGITIDIDHFGWIKELFDPERGRLALAVKNYNHEIKSLNQYIEIHGKDLKQTRNRIETEPTLDYLSRYNIIPKYGFPVDLVNLENKNPYDNTQLRLQRDLVRAISEYAPGSEVIADGKVLKSGYLKKIPNKSWPQYYYMNCPKCQSINIQEDLGQSHEDVSRAFADCPACHNECHGKYRQFLIPRYGFLYNNENIRDLVSNKPSHTYAGEVFYRGKTTTQMRPRTIHDHKIHCAYGINDELVVINKSIFNICPFCGYASLDSSNGNGHCTPYNTKCNHNLEEISLGHIFHTDVFVMSFDQCHIDNYDMAVSILAGLITAFSKLFYIDENEISGCLSNSINGFEFILYDNTPGGAGYVKHILNDDEDNVYLLIEKALSIAKNCDCGGGETTDCACYSCLLTYRNQRYHDKIKRSLVIEGLKPFEEST